MLYPPGQYFLSSIGQVMFGNLQPMAHLHSLWIHGTNHLGMELKSNYMDTWNEPLGHGIEIKLHLREGAGEYLEESKLKPYGFNGGQLEKGNVLKGLDLGVEGMRVGGQRLLIVPPQLAYGSKGVEEIPPNATIELDVELLAIKQSPFAYITWVLRSAFSIHHSGTLSTSI